MNDKIKILLIEENRDLRDNIVSALTSDDNFFLIDSLINFDKISEYITDKLPDIILFDIDNQGMDGIDFIRKILNKNPVRLFIMGSITQKGKYNILQSLEAGAIDFVAKPSTDLDKGWENMIDLLKKKLIVTNKANIDFFNNFNTHLNSHDINKKGEFSNIQNKVCIIGSGTGSITILKKFFSQVKSDFPGMIVITNLPEGITKTFADKMNISSDAVIKQAENMENIEPGKILIAPGDIHIKIIKSSGKYQTILENGEKINGYRPSIDVLMHSAVQQAAADAIGILLSGFDTDGIHGLLAMRRKSAKTFAVEPVTALFDTLPSAAIELDAVDRQVKSNDLIDIFYSYLK